MRGSRRLSDPRVVFDDSGAGPVGFFAGVGIGPTHGHPMVVDGARWRWARTATRPGRDPASQRPVR